MKLKRISTKYYSVLAGITLITLVIYSSLASPAITTFSLTKQETQWIVSHPGIRIGYDGYFPPFSYLGEQGRIRGYAVDYINLIVKKTGLDLQPVPIHQWQALYRAAQQKQVDIVATMVNRPERQKQFLFTAPYIFKSLAIITRNDSDNIINRSNLANKTVAMVAGYQYVDDIKKTFPSITPYYVHDIPEGLELVSSHHADAMISFISAFYWYREKYLLGNIKVAALYDMNSANESIAVRKDWPMLQKIIEKARRTMSPQELTQLSDKWLPETQVEQSYQHAMKFTSILLLIVVVLIGWMVQFRVQNRKIKKSKWLTDQANKELFSLKTSLEQQVEQRTDELFQLSYFDKTTGIANRNLFYRQAENSLKQAGVEQSCFALLTIDIERFKYINEMLGHSAGNEMLREIALRLNKKRASEDIVARYGGDEFVLLLVNADEQTVITLVRQLLSLLHRPFDGCGKPFSLSFSVGIALFPGDGGTINKLLRNAEAAMLKAKEEKSGFEFYQPLHLSRINDYIQLEQALLSAILELEQCGESSQFTLHYQPIKWVNKPGVKGFEALIRWHHPELGRISPVDFIPIAEDIGKIRVISKWVRKTALTQAGTWSEAGLEFGRISVNVSALELQYDDFVSQLEQEVTETSARFEWLEIEITETAVLKEPQRAIGLLKDVQQLGATISIDDFGTGHSSLVYLQEIPSNTVKIDRNFIKNLPQNNGDIAINKSIIWLCRSFGKTTVAEGVETIEQLNLLIKLGCDSIQGFFIDKPMPQEKINKNSHFFKLSMEQFIDSKAG